MNPKEFRLSVEQTEALECIAKENGATPANLVSLAVDALIAEAARNENWLPLPETRIQIHAKPQREKTAQRGSPRFAALRLCVRIKKRRS